MTTSSDGLVKLEPETTRAPGSTRHRGRRRKKIAARLLLILGLVCGVLAISDFAYNAYQKTACYTPAETDESGEVTQGQPRSEACRGEFISIDELQRLDAFALMFAGALLAVSVGISRKIPKRRR